MFKVSILIIHGPYLQIMIENILETYYIFVLINYLTEGDIVY